MRTFIIFLSSLIVLSCGNHKKITEEETRDKKTDNTDTVNNEDPKDSTDSTATKRVLGIVHTPAEGCPYYIETTSGKSLTLYPVNLIEKYQVEGLLLKFDYTLSRAQQPEGCKVDMVVYFDEVDVMRRGDGQN